MNSDEIPLLSPSDPERRREPTADGIRERADRFGDRARIITHRENRGLPAARNTGCREARGEFIVWLDADDMIAPRFLEVTLAVARAHPHAGWVAGLTVQFGAVSRLFGFAPYDPRELVRQNDQVDACLLCDLLMHGTVPFCQIPELEDQDARELLRTIPGTGVLTALAFLLEVPNLERYPTARKIATVALARRLLIAMWAITCKQEPYNYHWAA
ncbi:MAG: putative glycosyltransferase EpsH [Calditrichaeota bacterium]|nr:putative glycosyltransferase EpsH [Calditrichota bacterium]